MAFQIKTGDTSPSLLSGLEDGAGAPIDITGATVRFHMTAIGGATAKVDAAAVVVDAAGGVVRYDWVAGDTDTAGSYFAEFEVTYSNAAVETFPNEGNLRVDVGSDLA